MHKATKYNAFSVAKSFLLFVCLVLASCGWQLRSSTETGVALESLFVGSNLATHQKGPESILHVFDQRMRDLDIESSASLSAAQLGVVVLSEQRRERVLSLTSDLFEQQSRLSNTVEYQVWRGDELIVAREQVSTHRDMTADQSNAAAKNNEADLIYDEINVDLVNQIIRRVQRHTLTADEN